MRRVIWPMCPSSSRAAPCDGSILTAFPNLPPTRTGLVVDGGRAWADGDPVPDVRPCAFSRCRLGRRPRAAARDADADAAADRAGFRRRALADFYRQYEETMRRFLDQQERMLDHVLGLARGDHRLPPADAPAPTARLPPHRCHPPAARPLPLDPKCFASRPRQPRHPPRPHRRRSHRVCGRGDWCRPGPRGGPRDRFDQADRDHRDFATRSPRRTRGACRRTRSADAPSDAERHRRGVGGGPGAAPGPIAPAQTPSTGTARALS